MFVVSLVFCNLQLKYLCFFLDYIGVGFLSVYRRQGVDVKERSGLDRDFGNWGICVLQKGELGFVLLKMQVWYWVFFDF